jgi:hypothetical protein
VSDEELDRKFARSLDTVALLYPFLALLNVIVGNGLIAIMFLCVWWVCEVMFNEWNMRVAAWWRRIFRASPPP